MKGHAGYAGAALGLLSLFALGQAIPLVKEERADPAVTPRVEAPRAHSLEELEKLMKGREQKDGAPMKEKLVF